MSEEYQRLQEAASAVESEICELTQNHSISSAADLAALERRLDRLAVKRSSLTKALILLRCVNNPSFSRSKRSSFVNCRTSIILREHVERSFLCLAKSP